MGYSAMAHALVGYVERHLGCSDIKKLWEKVKFLDAGEPETREHFRW